MQKGINSKKDLIVVIVLIFILILTIILSIHVIYEVKGFSMHTYSLNAIVVEVNEDTIYVMEKEGEADYPNLYKVYFGEKGNTEFKQGQEVRIYHKQKYMSGLSYYTTYKDKVKKIEIIKEKSEIEIPDSVLSYYYSSMHKGIKIRT